MWDQPTYLPTYLPVGKTILSYHLNITKIALTSRAPCQGLRDSSPCFRSLFKCPLIQLGQRLQLWPPTSSSFLLPTCSSASGHHGTDRAAGPAWGPSGGVPNFSHGLSFLHTEDGSNTHLTGCCVIKPITRDRLGTVSHAGNATRCYCIGTLPSSSQTQTSRLQEGATFCRLPLSVSSLRTVWPAGEHSGNRTYSTNETRVLACESSHREGRQFGLGTDTQL